MVYGEGFAAADDVVGHELTHGVTEFSSHLFYYYQSGAINESMSDVFGEFVDLTNGAGSDDPADRWMLGEDLPGIRRDPRHGGRRPRLRRSRPDAEPELLLRPRHRLRRRRQRRRPHQQRRQQQGRLPDHRRRHLQRPDRRRARDRQGARIYYEVNNACSPRPATTRTSARPCAGLRQPGGTDGITAADCARSTRRCWRPRWTRAGRGAGAGGGRPATAPATARPDVFFDDLENPGPGNWTTTTAAAPNGWYYPQNPQPYGFDATYATSGDTNIWGYDRDDAPTPRSRWLPSVHVPRRRLPALRARLRLRHDERPTATTAASRVLDQRRRELERRRPADRGGGYNGTIARRSSNPLEGRAAFVGESDGYISPAAPTSQLLAGEDVRFRFRIGTDALGSTTTAGSSTTCGSTAAATRSRPRPGSRRSFRARGRSRPASAGRGSRSSSPAATTRPRRRSSPTVQVGREGLPEVQLTEEAAAQGRSARAGVKKHVIRVRAVDAAGNSDPSPAKVKVRVRRRR